MLLNLPLLAPFPECDLVGKAHIVLERRRDIPLGIVRLGGGRGESMALGDFLCIPEDLLAPPLHLAVTIWR